MSDIEKFLERVDTSGNCHLWKGAVGKDKMGYGSFWMGKRRWSAHRAAWRLFRGPIPSGMCVLHTCDTPLCVRLGHLFLGTKGDNNRDRAAKGRTVVPTGERHGRSKLTDQEVGVIRSLQGVHSQRQIGAMFGVSQTQVGNIHRGTQRKAVAA